MDALKDSLIEKLLLSACPARASCVAGVASIGVSKFEAAEVKLMVRVYAATNLGASNTGDNGAAAGEADAPAALAAASGEFVTGDLSVAGSRGVLTLKGLCCGEEYSVVAAAADGEASSYMSSSAFIRTLPRAAGAFLGTS